MKFSVIFVALCVLYTLAVRNDYQKANEVKVGEFPYIVIIRLKHLHTGNYMQNCAEATISEHKVLTNAVCATA